jgi:voltage-gated potassium channel
MNLFQQLAIAALLVALTLCLQCAGVAVTVEWLKTVAIRGRSLPITHSAVLVMQTTMAIIFLQGAIILLWADGYRRLCMWSWQSAFYFSAASYSTVGYGDVVLPSSWRLLGPLESMMGVLMCGTSVSLLFALINRLLDAKIIVQRVNPS